MEEEWAALDSSPCMTKVEGFVSQVCKEMSAEEAKNFLHRVKSVATNVDEANEITTELRPGEGLSFDITITTSKPYQVVVHASRVTEKEGYELLFLCSPQQFESRLHQLRDFHFAYAKKQTIDVEHFHDPWQDSHIDAIHETVAELRATVQHLGGNISTGPAIRLRRASTIKSSTDGQLPELPIPEMVSAAQTGNCEALDLTEDVPDDASSLTQPSKRNLVEAFDGANGPGRKIYSRGLSNRDKTPESASNCIDRPVHRISLSDGLSEVAPPATTYGTTSLQQDLPLTSTPSVNVSRYTVVSPTISLHPAVSQSVVVSPSNSTVGSSRFILASQPSPNGVGRETSRGRMSGLIGSPGPSRHSRGARSRSHDSARSPSASLVLPVRSPSGSVTVAAHQGALVQNPSAITLQAKSPSTSRSGSLQVRVVSAPTAKVTRQPSIGPLSPRGPLTTVRASGVVDTQSRTPEAKSRIEPQSGAAAFRRPMASKEK
jgi:hypothetical protein